MCHLDLDKPKIKVCHLSMDEENTSFFELTHFKYSFSLICHAQSYHLIPINQTIHLILHLLVFKTEKKEFKFFFH